jgi:acetyl esterase
MAELHPGAKRHIERVLTGPQPWEIPLTDARRAIDDETLASWGGLDYVADVADMDLDGVRGRVYRPDSDHALPVVVFAHGGGWVLGTIDSHDPFCRALAAHTPAVVVSVDYRLAPEHPFPAAIDDVWAATQWVARHATQLGGAPERIVVAGDSAGGNLAAVAALRARDAGLPLALQVLLYPVTDADLASSGYARYGEGLNLTRAKMRWFWECYLDGADATHPHASPLRADDLSALAPALVLTAEHDPLTAEGEAYAQRLREAGVPVTVTQYDGQIHGFVRLRAQCGEQADQAAAQIVSAIRAVRSAPRDGTRP